MVVLELVFTPVVVVVGDLFLLVIKLLPTRQIFLDGQPLERGEPVIVVTFAGVDLAPVFRFFQSGAKRIGPLFARQVSGINELNNDGKRLRLPWLGEDRTVFVTRHQWQICESS